MKLVCRRCKLVLLFEDGGVRETSLKYPCPKCKGVLISYKSKEAEGAWRFHFRKVHTGYKFTTVLDPVSLHLLTTEVPYFIFPKFDNGETHGGEEEKIKRTKIKFQNLEKEIIEFLKSSLRRKRIKANEDTTTHKNKTKASQGDVRGQTGSDTRLKTARVSSN